MGKIARIQLRGISRSPSDRLTTDGGLNESLNVQLDHTELVPMPKPEKVNLAEYTGNDTDALYAVDYYYIHKGSYYENIIARIAHNPTLNKKTRLVAFCKGRGKQELFELDESVDEKVTDIAAVGNTLVVTTTEKMHYILFRDGQYTYLGDHIPVPQIHFYMKPDNYDRSVAMDTSSIGPSEDNIDTDTVDFIIAPQSPDYTKGGTLVPDQWGVEDGAYRVTETAQLAVLKNIYDEINSRIAQEATNGKTVYPVFVRYAIRLYDGRLYACSAPVLLGCELSQYVGLKLISLKTNRTIVDGNTSYYIYEVGAAVRLPSAYSIVADFADNNLVDTNWGDIIEGVEIFISTPVAPYVNTDRIKLTIRETSGDDSAAPAILDPVSIMSVNGQRNLLLAHQTTYFAKKWDFSQFVELDGEVELSDINFSSDWISSQEPMVESYNSVHSIAGTKLDSINNRLILEGANQILYPGYPYLSSAGLMNVDVRAQYVFRWHLRIDGEEKTVITRDPQGNEYVKEGLADIYYETAIGYLSYPDARAFSVDVICTDHNDDSWFITYPAKSFTEIGASFVFLGFATSLRNDIMTHGSSDVPASLDEDPRVSIPDELLQSEADNPFLFPASGVLDFAGDKILGAAMATKALSPGQFGQFPIYVFTSTGIYSLSLNSEGAIVARHPVSRDVALEGTIVPIDQAVVFTTKKGVMMLTGSDIKDISPDMNGRHYVLDDESAASLNSVVPNLVYPAQRSESFMDFVKTAKAAYDYVGERLVFCSEKYGSYMYVYRLVTGTWHKMTLIRKIDAAGWGSGGGNWYNVRMNDPGSNKNAVATTLVANFPVTSIGAWMLIDGAPVIVDETNVQSSAEAKVTYLTTAGADAEYLTNYRDIYPVRWILNSYPDAWIVVMREGFELGIYNLSTVLEQGGVSASAMDEGLVVTRTLDFGIPDLYKSITRVKIRGEVDRRNNHSPYKYILLGSNDGVKWAALHSLRGPSFKYFRVVVLTTLRASERLSYLEIEYEPRFTNKIR